MTPIEVTIAGPGHEPCPVCGAAITSGQRIALTRSDDLGHAWIHIRCLAAASAEKAGRQEHDRS